LVQQAKTPADVLAESGSLDGKPVAVIGTVTEVCIKAGCWVKLDNDSGEPLFVKFTCPFEGRLMPMEAIGKQVVVTGTLKTIEVDEATRRHYAEDAGASQDEIDAITGSETQVRIMGESALLQAS